MESEAEIRKQILQMEFQHKKDIAELRESYKKNEDTIERILQSQERTQKHLEYITQLTGIAFEDLEFQSQKMSDAGDLLKRKK